MTTATVSSTSTAASDLDSYLRTLTGPKPGARLLEIRFALRHRDMGRVFIAAHSAAGATRFIRRLSVRTDVYVGVALRNRRSGGRDAIDRSHLLFIEIDSPDGEQRLARFAHPPTTLIASGSSPGHVHAYWTLHTPIGVLDLERANRRLAHHLGGDLASVDAARILRPPSSWNHKRTPPEPVRLLDLDPARQYEPDELVDGLPDPPGTPARQHDHHQRRALHLLDRALLAIPAEQYVHALTGIRPNKAGKIPCPFHDDRVPSLQLYGDGSWYCFGCRQGGTIYDFASLLWLTGQSSGWKLRGREFLWVRQRLAEILGGETAPGVLTRRSSG